MDSFKVLNTYNSGEGTNHDDDLLSPPIANHYNAGTELTTC